MDDILARIKLIKEGAVVNNDDTLELTLETAEDLVPLTLNETISGIDMIYRGYMIESSENIPLRDRIKKFFKWLIEKVIAFFKAIINKFKSKRSINTKIIMANKNLILNYNADTKIHIWSRILYPRFDFKDLVAYTKDYLSKWRNLVVTNVPSRLSEIDEIADWLIERVFHVKDFSSKYGPDTKKYEQNFHRFLEEIYGPVEEISLLHMNKKKIIERLLEFEKYERVFVDLYHAVQKVLTNIQNELMKIDDEVERPVDVVLESTTKMVQATSTVITIAENVANEGYNALREICEKIIYVSRNPIIDKS